MSLEQQLGWMVGKDVEKKGQSLQRARQIPKQRSCGFKDEEASKVLEGGGLSFRPSGAIPAMRTEHTYEMNITPNRYPFAS